MSFSCLVKGSELVNTLGQLDALTGGASEYVTLKFDGKRSLWLYKEAKKSEQIRAGRRLEVNGKKTGTITVNASVLAGLCRRNQELLLEYKNKELTVSNQKAYQATCLTVKSEATTKIISKKAKDTRLNEKFQKILVEALGQLSLKDHFQSEVPITVSVWATKKRTVIGASDNYHGASYTAKGNVELEFHLPINYALRLSSLLAEHEALSIGVDSSSFYLWGNDLQVSWPLVAPKAEADKFRKVFGPAETNVAEMDQKEISTILANLRPLYEKLSHLRLNVDKKSMTFQVKSAKGSASESIKYQVGELPKLKLAVNPLLFEDIIALLPTKFQVGFTKDATSIVFESSLKYGKVVYRTLLASTEK